MTPTIGGYDKLVIVDQYEASHDNRAATRRACDVMSEYLANLTRPLPDVAAHAVTVAREYAMESVGVDRLHDAAVQVSRFVKERKDPGENDRGVIFGCTRERSAVGTPSSADMGRRCVGGPVIFSGVGGRV